MDTNEINKLLMNEKKFIGVFALDKLPKRKINTPASLIINTDVSKKNGEHWVALVIVKNQAYYFDSFGLQIIDKEILRFLSTMKCKEVTYSKKCIQSINSNKCGLFCILFVKLVKDKKQYESFLDMFLENQLRLNDHLVLEYLNYKIL